MQELEMKLGWWTFDIDLSIGKGYWSISGIAMARDEERERERDTPDHRIGDTKRKRAITETN